MDLFVTGLRTEYRVDPLGTDVARPRFDYRLQSSLRGEKQTAYRILAASSEGQLAADQGDLWDTGKVASDQTSQIVYAGKPLSSRQTAWWKVQVWDKDGVPSPWSPTASWELGLAAKTDWQAQWISTASPPFQPAGVNWIWFPEGAPSTSATAGTRLFRRTFAIPPGATVRSATIAISVDDAFDLYVNGTHAGSASDWRAFPDIDVTGLLAPGNNTIAVLATNSSPSPAGVLAQMTVDLGTGTPLVVATDASFRCSNASPPPAGWQLPGFDDSKWTAAMNGASYGQGPWGSLVPGASGGGPARYLRRSFALGASVRRARLYATALGLYEASINGKRVGVEHLTPGWTDYTKRVQVQTYDVTAALSQGENVLGLVVTDGWYQGKVGYAGRGHYGVGPDRALAQLEVTLSDGTTQTIATDATWDATTAGPIEASDLLDGETYDARREMAGWYAPGFAPGAGWAKAVVNAPTAPPDLVAQPDDGIQVETTITPISMKTMASGARLYDLGQNIAGWVRLVATGPAGATLILRHGEVLNPDGSLYTTNLRGAAATDTYTLRGGAAMYEPHATIHGFRYVELSGDVAKLTAAPSLGTITAVVAHAATQPTGTHVTSDANVNKLVANIVWSQKDNFTAVPSDCPQRDERLGWMGDAQIFAMTATLNMDVAAFYTKWMRDVDGAQQASGAFTNVSPNPPGLSGQGTPAWGDAGVIVPWAVYLAYGDTRVLEENYPSMKAWVDYIASNNPNHLWQASRGDDFGDWLNVNAETDHELLGTAFFAHSADVVSHAAAVLGNATDAAKYSTLFASISSAFAAAYLSPDGHLKGDTQTAYALALRFGLLPTAQQGQAASLLRANIASHGGYLTTGFVGVGHLLPALSAAGMNDTAYSLLQNDGYPSWRYEIDRGATTTWERWDGIKPDGTFQDPAMNSFNHYSFGSVGEWMYQTIGGLVLDEANPGWKAFRIRPRPGGGLTSARAALASIHGTIVSDWSIDAGKFTLTVTVPVNTTATVYMPFPQRVLVDGEAPPAPAADGGYAVASGTYVFTAPAM